MFLVVLLIGTPLFIFFGWLSDRIGRKWIMITGIALGAVTYVPIYNLMAAQSDTTQWGNEIADPAIVMNGPNSQGDSTGVATHKFEGGGVLTEEWTKLPGIGWIEGPIKVHLPQSNLFTLGLLLFVQLVFVTMAYGPIAAFLVELFPANIRYTSMSLPYHIGNGVFGGLTPLIAESLVLKTGNILAGVYYPVIIATVTVIVGVLAIREKKL